VTESHGREGTTWRYCITREKDEHGEDWFTLREVYTAPDGALSWTEDAVAAGGDSWRDCADDLSVMGRAIGAPVLDLTLDPPAFVSVRDVYPPRKEEGR
jgi:hypothetical protein